MADRNRMYTTIVFRNVSKCEDGTRTCCHLLPERPEPDNGLRDLRELEEGDYIHAIGNERAPRGYLYLITGVRVVRLLDDTTEETAKKNGADSVEAYLKRWDEIHPGFPSSSNPVVVRYDFYKTNGMRDNAGSLYSESDITERINEAAQKEIQAADDKEWLDEVAKRVATSS